MVIGSDSQAMAPANTEHIRWPTNFEDLHWYLYELPGSKNRNEGDWLRWVDDRGGVALAGSGYRKDTAPAPTFTPCTIDGDQVARDTIDCSGLDGNIFYPFDVHPSGAAEMLGPDYLVAAGVASPVDAGADGEKRKLNRFDFEIREAEIMGSADIEAEGADALRRYGVPLSSNARRVYLERWPVHPGFSALAATPAPTPTPYVHPEPVGDLNPNVPYLMVLAFYEHRNPREQWPDNFVNFKVTATDGSSYGEFDVPERYIRRVVCRAVVLPSGFNPAFSASKNILEKGWDSVKNSVDGLLSFFSNFLWKFFVGLITSPVDAAARGAGMVCTGMDQVTVSLTPTTRVPGVR